MKITKLVLIIVIGLFMVFGGGAWGAEKPERPLRAVIPPPQEEEAPPAVPPQEEEKPAIPATPAEKTASEEEKAKETPKPKTAKELETEKKQRVEYLQTAQGLVDNLEQLRITVQFGGDWEEFRKRLLEAGFTLYRTKTKAQGPMAQAASLGLLESSANNFVLAKDAWEQAKNKREEANRNYKLADQAFPESQRRFYREQRETALGGVYEMDAPWVKAYNDYKQRGDTTKRESEQLMQTRDSYLGAAYSSLDAAKEALTGEGKEK